MNFTVCQKKKFSEFREQASKSCADSSGQDKTIKNPLCSPQLYLPSSKCSPLLSIPVEVIANQVKGKMSIPRIEVLDG